MSTPTARPFARATCDGERRRARAAADVEHVCRGSRANGVDEQILERFEQPIEQLLRFDPAKAGALPFQTWPDSERVLECGHRRLLDMLTARG